MAQVVQQYDVYGIGHAIVDTEALVDDAMLERYGLDKGLMTLISAETQAMLLAGLDGRPLHHAAGGSAANTMVGVAQLGGRACYTGRVGADERGDIYRASLAKVGVDFNTPPPSDEATGSCLVLVTPDGERTMQTSLGASAHLRALDVDSALVAASGIAYIEGYLFSSQAGRETAEHAVTVALNASTPVALSLSDPAIAAHFIEPLRRAASCYANVLFCNEREAEIYSGGGSREESLQAVGEHAPIAFMTCGADGAMVCDHGAVTKVPGHAVTVVDTTGAGDAFAAGALYGLARGMSAADAARIGVFISARIVAQLGPRLLSPPDTAIAAMLAGARPFG